MSAPVDREIAQRLEAIESRIARACAAAGRARAEVKLVAVSKKQPAERVLAAYHAGQRLFGENYLQELEARAASMPSDIEWHFVGHLQRNKAKKATELAALVHTVDSVRLGHALDAAAGARNRRLPVLLQINIDQGPTKEGVAPADAPPLLDELSALEHLEIRGLMAIPEPGAGRAAFRALRRLAESLRAMSGLPLPELSMGMSADFEDAVLEGATLVRIGTEIFGARDPRI